MTTDDAADFASRCLTDATFLARRAALALSRVGVDAVGYCIVLHPNDEPLLAVAKSGTLQRVGLSPSEALRARYVDPLRVPLAQRDRFIDPIATGFVARTAGPAPPVVALLRALGVDRMLRQHVCIGARLVGGLGHLTAEDQRCGPRQLARLDAIAATWRPILRSHALLLGVPAAAAAVRRSAAIPLTARQRQIVAGVADGLTNADIARRLKLSPDTVKTTLHRLYDKVGVRGRLSLVRAVAGAPLL